MRTDAGRSRRGVGVGALALALALGPFVASCGGDPGQPSSSDGQQSDPEEGLTLLKKSLEDTESSMQDAAAAMRTGSLTPQDGIVQIDICGSAPTEAGEVSAYGRLVGGSGPLPPRLEEASARLQEAGWTQAGDDLDSPSPVIGMTKGSARLVLGGDIRRDGDALTFSMTGPCYRFEPPLRGLGRTSALDFSS